MNDEICLSKITVQVLAVFESLIGTFPQDHLILYPHGLF